MKTSQARSLLVRLKQSVWTKFALLAAPPVALYLVIAAQASWRPRTLPGGRADVFQIAFSPDGALMAVAAQDNARVSLGRRFDDAVDIWDARRRVRLHQIRLRGQSLGSIAFSPDGRSLAGLVSWRNGDPLGYMPGNAVRIWDARTGETQRVLRIGNAHSHHLYWSDADVVTFSDAGDGMRQWDAKTGKLKRKPQPYIQAPGAISPDGTMVMLAQDSVELRDARTWKLRHTLRQNYEPAIDLMTFSSDSTLVAGSLSDSFHGVNAIQLWDVQSGKLKRTLRGVLVPSSLALSPDKKIVATGESGNAIKLWNAENGMLLRVLKGHRGMIITLAFSPDGATLASGGTGGTVKLWRIK